MIASVRAKLDGQWATLTYNEATGRYEGELIPTKTSYHEEGGYFPVEVEAVNADGGTASAGADTLKSLRLVVREVDAPTIAPVSPEPGYLLENSQTFVFFTRDEEGGSGINPESAKAFIDGLETPCAVSEEDGGYLSITVRAEGLSEGPHTVSAAVSDYDGNETPAAAEYIVDTIPPELVVYRPSLVHVVDQDTVVIAGETGDASGVSLTVAGKAVGVAGGRFSAAVPLEIGENRIPILAQDGAGNQSHAEVYMIRLVTDRTPADVERLQEMFARGYGNWTELEKEWYRSAKCLRGSYDSLDYNRVSIAVKYLAGQLRARGYIVETSSAAGWMEGESVTRTPAGEYLRDVCAVRDGQGLYLGELPVTTRFPTVEGANQIERALVEANALFSRYRAITSGQIAAGIYR